MTMQLVPLDNEQDFLLQLNRATGHQVSLPHLKVLKFDAQTGEFKLETDETDGEGKPVYSSVGSSIDFNIVKIRTMVQSKFNVQSRFYSREFDGSYFELYDESKTVIWRGPYNQFKADPLYADAQYVKVIYGFYGDTLVRFKLAGSKLSPLFEYQNYFNQDNPARYMTVMAKGQQSTNGSVKYYEMTMTKGEGLPMQTIIDRVNKVNEFLDLYQQQLGVATVTSDLNVLLDQPPMPTEEPAEPTYHADDAIAQKFETLPF